MKKKIVVIAIIAFLKFGELCSQPNTLIDCGRDCAGKEFPYLFCDATTNKVVQKCSRNPRKPDDPNLKPYKVKIPINFDNCPDFYDDTNLDFYDIKDDYGSHVDYVFKPSDVENIIKEAAKRWTDLCPPQTTNVLGDPLSNCCPKIVWTKETKDMGASPKALAVTFRKVKQNGSCERDCDSVRIVLNDLDGMTDGLDEFGDPKRFFWTDENTRPEYYSLRATITHELGHWFGIGDIWEPTLLGEDCDDSEQNSMVSQKKNPNVDAPLTNNDECMFRKLYCCSENTETYSVEDKLLTGEYDFSIVPNPATLGSTAIKFTANLTSYRKSIMVYNSLGKLVVSKSVKSGETEALITTKNLEAGKYMISVTFDKLKGKIGRQLVIVK